MEVRVRMRVRVRVRISVVAIFSCGALSYGGYEPSVNSSEIASKVVMDHDHSVQMQILLYHHVLVEY